MTRKSKYAKILLTALSLILLLSLAIAPVSAADVSNADELVNALGGSAYAEKTGENTVTLNQDVTVAEQININGGNLILTTNGSHVISRVAYNIYLFNITSASATFTIKGTQSATLTLDGKNSFYYSDTRSVVHVQYGNFKMEEGSKIYNNTVLSPTGGGVFVENNGTFTMSGGTISGNKCTCGGVCIWENGTFTMSGGTISNNTATYGGGGVCIWENGTFTLSGGTISGNTGSNGGGVSVNSNGTFTMSGGTISGNTGSEGGGVFVNGNGTFTMSGGTISGNKAGNYGSGGGVYNLGTFTMSGGTISGNTAGYDGSGVFFYGTFTIKGSSKISDEVYIPNTKLITYDGREPEAKKIILESYSIGKYVVNKSASTTEIPSIDYFELNSTTYELISDGTNLKIGDRSTTQTEITFDGNGGQPDTQHANATLSSKYLNRTVTNPTRDEDIFLGWYTSSTGGDKVIDTEGNLTNISSTYTNSKCQWIYNVSSSTTFYAQWIKIHTVSFDSDGGTPTPSEQKIVDGSLASEPVSAPTKTGYGFNGWYNGDTKWNFVSDTVTSNITLKANWNANPAQSSSEYGYVTYEVFFDSQGGSHVDNISNLLYGAIIKEPLSPVKSGFTFDGWYTEDDYKWDFPTDSVTKTFTLYAKWIEVPTQPVTTAVPKAEQTKSPVGLVGLIAGLGCAFVVLKRNK